MSTSQCAIWILAAPGLNEKLSNKIIIVVVVVIVQGAGCVYNKNLHGESTHRPFRGKLCYSSFVALVAAGVCCYMAVEKVMRARSGGARPLKCRWFYGSEIKNYFTVVHPYTEPGAQCDFSLGGYCHAVETITQ